MEFKMKEEDNKNNEIKKAIVSTIAYFDMFDYPLTDFEVWKFLLTPNSAKQRQTAPSEVQHILKDEMIEIIERKNGFYFLKGRSKTVETRLKRYVYADRKFKRAMRAVKIFKSIPWIKMIAVSNVIGAHNSRDGSDIDLFIITEKEKIWITRFFCISIAQLLGLRPKEGNTRDKICLNFYVSEEAMNLESLMLRDQTPAAGRGASSPTKFIDIYFVYWLANLIPIYEVGSMYKKFIRENNWVRNYFPNWQPARMERRRYVCRPSGSVSAQTPRVCKRINIFNLLNRFESQFKKLQLKLMPDNLKELMNKDTRVVVNDRVLKLHINDRRSEYREKFYNRLSALLSF